MQTNEVGRCWALLPLFLLAASSEERPLDLIELGPSAGLNLCWDRYRYEYPGLEWGQESAVVLSGEWRGEFPRELFGTRVEVRRRIGIDRAPVDATSIEGALLLQSFLWPDQPERLERQRTAISIMREDPPELIRGDYVEVLPTLLAEGDPDALTIVFSSASTEYLTEDAFTRLAATIVEAGEGVAWVAMEPARGTRDYAHFFLELDRRRLANVQYHGRWVEWLA